MKVRLSTYIYIISCLAMACMVYYFENKVHEVTEKIADVNEKLSHYDNDLRVLEAEWSYLNDPDRLGKLTAQIHDDMNSPIRVQFTNLKDLPTREVMSASNAGNITAQNIIP